MHQKKIIDLVESKSEILKKTGYSITKKTSLQYGEKIFFTKNSETAALVIYWSSKKGFSFVLEGNFSSKEELVAIFKGEDLSLHSGVTEFNQYVGMDESGKGDFFGPLVAAGFYCKKNDLKNLMKAGVRDCKKLTNRNTLEIAQVLRSQYHENIRTVCLMPEEYNVKYEEFTQKGLKLNSMLGNLYAILINDFENSTLQPDGYYIDRFGDEKFVISQLTKKIKLKMDINAEVDMAVAAASIIARAVFLEKIQELSQILGENIPLGAGAPVDTFAKKYIKPLTPDKRSQFIKVHFKSTEKMFQ